MDLCYKVKFLFFNKLSRFTHVISSKEQLPFNFVAVKYLGVLLSSGAKNHAAIAAEGGGGVSAHHLLLICL